MGNCVSSVIDLFHSSVFTDRQRQMDLADSSSSTALQRQMEQGDSFTSKARQMDLADSSTSTTLQRQLELGGSSTSTARQTEVGSSSTMTVRQQHREPEKAFDGIVQPSPSYSTLRKKGSWDVFINHRSCDVKHKLASTIYHTLDLVGLSVFLDVEELELGDSIPKEIEKAMTSSGLHIAIFSENYAQSPWCLAELSFMLETGNTILPVFYHVQPDDLRWVAQGKGLYAHAFSQHEEKGRYSPKNLEEWKTALQRVSYLSGYMLNSNNDDEGMLLKSIVNSVLRVMKKEPLEVAKHPVGMDEIVEDFERSRQEYIESEQHVEIVGIVGFGGSGNTTLATELYNRKSSSIDRSSFLYDVRGAASRNALHTKQKKLLEDLRIQNNESFDNFKEGKRILHKSLISLRVLIVLDDVDQEDQLDALLPPKESLGLGSMVIITTREGDVLTKRGITSIYKMQPLQDFHAKQLFCWNAFLRPFPQKGFEDLVENCLDVCNGLPLSLEVIGGQLYGKRSKEYWVSELEKIRRILPKEIKKRLKVSYDALDEDEKEIFLDVACFFIGEKISSGIAVWDGSGWSGLHSWETLHNKCLVEVDEKEYIRMHDHLRDLGREIATTHSPSRFWFQRQSIHIQRGIPIRGIMATTGLSGCTPPFKQYTEMMRISNVRGGLQLLLVQENDFTQDCGELSRDLLWLRWFNFKHGYIPSWFSLENIRVLELLEARKLEALWEDAHPPLQLRELLVRGAYMLRSLPRSIGYLKHLKRLSLGCCYEGSGLSYLPEEFCRLRSLEHLALEYCIKLSCLPSRCGDLVNLRHINLRGCQSLERLPESFKELIRLEYLNLSDCVELILESNILENISNLKFFDVSGCYKLDVLPNNITNQACLTQLILRYTSSLRELPATIGRLGKLENLEIVGSPLLTKLPTDVRRLSNLRNLRIENCSLRELDFGPGLRSLSSLRELYLLKTSVFRISLPQDCCPSLETLCVEICPSLMEIESLPTALKSIKLRECTMLGSLGLPGAIEQLTNLQILEIGKCSIRELRFGRGSSTSLRGLRQINIWDTSVCRISLPQDCCPSLETLRLEICPSLMEIETLPAALKSIHLKECTKLARLGLGGAIGQLTNLQTLEIRKSSIRELPFGRGSFSLLRELRQIYIGDTSVSRISLPQDCCPSLETLHLEICPSLIEIETLPTALKFIKLIGCTMLVSLGLPGAFEQLTNLQTLEIRGSSIRELPFGRGSSSSLCNLRSILLEATHLSRVSISQESCPSLHVLRIENEEYLMEIETLPSALKIISLVNCKMLKNIRGIHSVVNVEKLSILVCPELYEMPNFAGLVSLNNLDVEDCNKIKKIEGLEHLASLEELLVWTRWMVPGIHSLGGTEKLRTLNLRTDNISAFEPCIRSIHTEKWPWEMTISAKMFHHVQSILDSFTFPGLTVVKNSLETVHHYGEYTEWSITSSETNLSSAAIVCYFVCSYEEGSCLGVNEGQSTRVELSKGEWVVISVFREVSPLIKDGRRFLQASIDEWVRLPFEVNVGWLIVGERGSVFGGFKHLFQTLCKAASMS